MIPTIDVPEIHLVALVVGSLLVLDAVVSLLLLSRLDGGLGASAGDPARSADPGTVGRDDDPGGEGSGRAGPDDVPEGVDRDADLVVCRQCGTPNERGYRFCRQCVSELSGGYDVATPVRSRFDRRTP